MNRLVKHLISIVLTICLLLQPALYAQAEGENVQSFEDETGQNLQVQLINPLYADVISEDDLNEVPEDVPTVFARTKYEENEDVLGDIIREAMREKQDSVLMYVKFNEAITNEEELEIYVSRLAEKAFKETSNHKEGDYIRYQYASIGISMSDIVAVQDGYQATLVLVPTYYTMKEQEDMVDAKLATVLWEILNLDRENLSDYEKTKAIYDYICDNVTYDHTNLEDDNYTLKYTAYAALIDGTAVCQGYAVLFYRMMEEVGVDTRVVAGDGGGPHAWNISKLGDKYYYSDSTWDAGVDKYNYFLKGSSKFGLKHFPYLDSVVYEDEYEDVLSETDFTVAEGSCGENATWMLDEEGTLTISGTGSISDNSGYGKHKAAIKKLVIEEGITRIEAGVFASFYNLSEEVVLPESIEYIGENAFYNCMMIPKYTILNTNCEIYDSKDVFYIQVPLAGHYGSTVQEYAEKYNRTFRHETNMWESEYSVEVEPTCTEQGIQGIKCAKCNFWKDQMYISRKGHTEEIIPAVAPTCEDTGLTAGVKCSTCGDVFVAQEEVTALGHIEETIPAVAPTCEDTGLTAGVRCLTCGDVLTVQEEVDALGHNYGEWIIDSEATCTDDGSKHRECNVCDDVEIVVIPSPGHSHGEWIIDSEATCEAAGSKHRECDVCDDVETVVIPAAHSWNKDYTVDKAATCKAAGSKSIHCAKCSAIMNVTAIAQLAHKWNSGVINPAPTCTKAGVKTYTCSSCGGKKTEAIKATGHNYKITKTTKATTKKNGKLAKQCKVCKYKTTETLYRAKTVSLSKTKFVYNGKTQKPKVVVKDSKGRAISTSNYKVSFSKGCKNAGTYKVTVKFKGQYSGKLTKTFKITKAKQAITANNFTKVKDDKAFSINAKRPSGGGKLTYKTSNKKIATVSSKGKVTIKKAGKVTITITAASNKNYNKATKKITVTIK